MQSLNLLDYIKVYKVFEKESLKKILLELQDESIWERHQWTNQHNNIVEGKSNNEMFISDNKLFEANEHIMSNIYSSISKYIKDINIPEFTSWQGYSSVRFNRYEKNQSIVKHVDNITSIFDGSRKGSPTLSIVGLLNNTFTGGEFVMFDSYKLNLEAGDILIFPSFFTYPHRVNPVTEGVRYSFVSWVW